MDRFKFDALQLVETNPFVNRIGRFTFVLILFFIVILFLPWRQTVQGEGTLIAYDPTQRIQSISAPIDGFIDTFYVSENEHVQQGMKLFNMIDPDKDYKTRVYKMKEDFEQQHENIENELIVLKQKDTSLLNQKKIRLELYDKHYIQAEEQLKSLQLKYQAEKKNYEVLFNHFTRIKQLYVQKIESKKHYEKAENQYINSKITLEKIEIDIEVQKRNLSIIQQEKQHFLEEIGNQIRTLENNMLGVETRLNILKRDYEKHLTEIARYETSSVISQKDGSVMRILENDKNTYIKKGQPVIRFSPDVNTSALLLKVSDFNMPLMKEGLPVRIRFYGWPVLYIPGWPVIRFGTFGGIVKRVDPVLHEKGAYYAYVVEDPNEPWPSHEKLRVGTGATAWVALSSVPIWYELWRLMNAFPANMVTPEKK
ncbi:HlyD family secretion protein [Sulfurovum sp. TSL1]|uniref:HlyD family secretion protein n=1 Tax=Sulfurovum sp. TSL1 TaxID=2826994 RepID=UPI001CC69A1E|nr:HlyD family secretion protein [Sulfurovum sp. TSL1]GIT97417.1 biotin attachment protein [Sulfurovum sp. TSL1]